MKKQHLRDSLIAIAIIIVIIAVVNFIFNVKANMSFEKQVQRGCRVYGVKAPSAKEIKSLNCPLFGQDLLIGEIAREMAFPGSNSSNTIITITPTLIKKRGRKWFVKDQLVLLQKNKQGCFFFFNSKRTNTRWVVITTTMGGESSLKEKIFYLAMDRKFLKVEEGIKTYPVGFENSYKTIWAYMVQKQ